MGWFADLGLSRRSAPPLATALSRTWRVRRIGVERWQRAERDARPYLFLLWHEALVPLLWAHRDRDIAIVVSASRDGQYLIDWAASLGYRILPGSSSRGGVRALLGAVKLMRAGVNVGITPDGPRGPRRCLQPGILLAAQRSGGWIVPLHAVASRSWRLGSWDRMMIPKPLARVTVGYGEPFLVEPGEAGQEAGGQRCRAAMAELERELEVAVR